MGASRPAIVIFGASGDLTQRKLMPAVHSLGCEGLLPEGASVLGVARSSLSEEEFRTRMFDGVQSYARLSPRVCKLWAGFQEQVSYLHGSYEDPGTYREISRRIGDSPCLFYLATPPELSPLIVEWIGKAGLSSAHGGLSSAKGGPSSAKAGPSSAKAGPSSANGGWRRVIVEKPFGRDLQSARELNRRIHDVFREDQIYRIDHYLGKETVQNILTLRFANAIFEPLWNRNYIDNVQITVSESVGVEHRAGYYESAGVLRDMFQNHLLQLLTLTAMEPPPRFEAEVLRDEKVKVLRALRPGPASARGQYRGYRAEPGVSPATRTATFAALELFVDNWRWQGVPFYLRSGKMLAEQSSEVCIRFRDVPHLMFPLEPGERILPNILTMRIQPDEGVHLRFEAKRPGMGMKTRSMDMDFRYADGFGEGSLPEAYERLLLDALQGDASLFARSDEIEAAWSVVDPIVESWEKPGAPPLMEYEPGTWGPAASDELLAGQGRTWVRKD